MKSKPKQLRSVKPAAKKATVKKRSVNAKSPRQQAKGAPVNEQDIKRRLGQFTGAGEHSRSGRRGS